jgi:hypothetical protein
MSENSILDLSNMGLDETTQLVYLPKGTEVEVRIVNVVKDVDKNGEDYIMPYFEVINHEDADAIPEFSTYIPFPSNAQTPKENNKRKLRLSSFLQAFDVDGVMVNLKELKGLTGFVVVGYKETEDYGPQNTVNKFVTGN